MEYKDYYKVIGIDKKATSEEVKKAFRALTVRYHPDKNPDNKVAKEKFKSINEASDVLSRADKRKKYDELGENWQQAKPGSNKTQNKPFGGNGGNQRYDERYFGYADEGAFSDFFQHFFSGKIKLKTPTDVLVLKDVTMKQSWKRLWRKPIQEQVVSSHQSRTNYA